MSTSERRGARRREHQSVEVTPDIVYRQATSFDGEPVDLELDIYRGTGASEQCPVIMWLFDGGFVRGDKRQMAYYAKDAARRGWAGVTVQYRTRPIGTGDFNPDYIRHAADDAYDDALAAVHWLRDNAASHRLNPRLIVAAGVSAGAVTALHLVYTPGPGTSPVAGGIAVAGDCLVAPPPGRPPVIMFHGRLDWVIPYSRAEETHRRAVAAGNVNTFVSFDEDGHDIGWRRAPQIRDMAASFLARHVLEPSDDQWGR